jgi:iron complex outermembrane receptor protein
MKRVVNYFIAWGLCYPAFVYSIDFKELAKMSLDDLMQVEISISTQTKQSLSSAPSVVTLITANDIKNMGATNLADVLRAVPGIYILYNNFAFRPLLRFRGTNSKQSILLINGSPMNDLMWRLGIFWKGLPVSMIERIEIIRGPGSALFGTDASAGVINVITKTASGINANEVGLRSGSYDSHTAWMQYGSAWNGFDIASTLEVSRTDGHAPWIETDAQTRNDTAFGTNASLAPDAADFGWRNMDLHFAVEKAQWRLLADYAHHSDVKIGTTGAGALDPLTQGDDKRFEFGLFYQDEKLSNDWGLNAEVRYRYLDYTSGDGFQEWPPGYTNDLGVYPDGVLNHMESKEQRASTEFSLLYRGFDKHTMRFGGGYNWLDLYYVNQQVNFGVDAHGNALPAGSPLVDISDSPYAFAPERQRNISYLFLQDVWRINQDWELTAGFRYDRYSDFGSTWSPRFAAVWQPSKKLTAKLIYGRAFRAPDFQELFAETSRTLPNPDLNPEYSTTWELSFAYAFSDKLHLSTNVYRYQQNDFISAQPMPGLSKPKYQNSGEHVIKGIEVEAWWQAAKHLRISGNYTYRNPDDSPFRLHNLPNQQAYARMDWHLHPDWTWNLQALWFDARNRRSNDARADLEGYWHTDTTLRFHPTTHWEFAVSVRNLFDSVQLEPTGASIPNDLPMPERHFYAEIRYHF